MTQLQSKRLITAKEISERHAVSIRTVYRDIRTLEKSGVPIRVEEGKGYCLMEGYKVPPVMFTEEEANALITAEQLIERNRDESLTEHYRSAITKIRSVLKQTQKDKTELLSERIQIRSNRSIEKTSNYLIQLQKGITNYEVFEINYVALNGKQSQRHVEPFAMYSTNENWILVAFCRLKQEYRAFRLDCIQYLRATGLDFAPHSGTLQDYFDDCRKKLLQTPDIPLTQAPDSFVSNQIISRMKTTKIDAFKFIGITVRTSNQDGQGAKDIPNLWNRFMTEGIASQIPGKLDSTIYAIYTNYEGDHEQPYDIILGCRVNSLDDIPSGMVGQEFESGTYTKFVSKGDVTKGAIYNTWMEIWNTDLNRSYVADFEVYGEKAMNPNDAEVDIYISLKE